MSAGLDPEQFREESYRRLAAIDATSPDADGERTAFTARRAERERRRAAEDTEAQAWFDSRPDVQEALRGSLDKGTRVRRGRPTRKDTSEAAGVEDQP